MSKKATIYTYTVIHIATEAFKDRTPYLVAVVDDGERRFFTRVEGYEADREVGIGTMVEFSHLDELGKPVYKLA